jgi:Zn-dependent peptidase ImmA (M78 family)
MYNSSKFMEKYSRFEKNSIKRKAREIIWIMRRLDAVAQGYNDVVEQEVLRIYKSGCSIAIVDNVAQFGAYSWHEHTKDQQCIIRLNAQADNPKHILWTLFHEFGHHLDTTEYQNTTKVDREFQAWKYAEDEFRLYPFLEQDYNDFKQFQRFCLSTYLS